MMISSRDFSDSVDWSDDLHKESYWKWGVSNHDVSFSIGFPLVRKCQINPTSENTKISTWNHHNFLTSEPILIKLEIFIIANIDSESIAGVLSSGNHKQKTFFYKLFLDTTSDITSTYFSYQLREAAHVRHLSLHTRLLQWPVVPF